MPYEQTFTHHIPYKFGVIDPRDLILKITFTFTDVKYHTLDEPFKHYKKEFTLLRSVNGVEEEIECHDDLNKSLSTIQRSMIVELVGTDCAYEEYRIYSQQMIMTDVLAFYSNLSPPKFTDVIELDAILDNGREFEKCFKSVRKLDMSGREQFLDLTESPFIEVLDCAEACVYDIAHLTNLRCVSVGFNDFIDKLPSSVEYLRLGWHTTKLSDLSNLTNLTELGVCADDLHLTLPSNVVSVRCGGRGTATLDLSKCEKLHYLSVGSTYTVTSYSPNFEYCAICMNDINVATNPCPTCRNKLCACCLGSVELCPFCRVEF